MNNATNKITFALYFGNRANFPGSLMAGARKEMTGVLKKLGYGIILPDEKATRYGAVETSAEGAIYAQFLDQNRGKFDGVIVSLPNFGDENGAVAALKDAGVPILIQAYPDELDKMDPLSRRDAFCGKLSIMDVFRQNGIRYTALKPHTVTPTSKQFADQVNYFDRLCRVVRGLKNMKVGALGARTTAFKTVRIDEIALQRHGITVETFDLSDIFDRMAKVKPDSQTYAGKTVRLKEYADFSKVPADAFDRLARLSVVIDTLVGEYNLDALAVRCWMEMQEQLRISPCVLLSELNDRFVTAACEVDIGNAVAMHALSLASGEPPACLDWNNNYGDDEDKCILFHCGPVPQTMMTARGIVSDHGIIKNALGEGCGFGCNVGRIKPLPFTFGSLATDAGALKFFVGEGRFTNDPIPQEFFGCAGVAHIAGLQDVLLHVGREGHRHHVSVTPGTVAGPLREALGYYLGFDVRCPQES